MATRTQPLQRIQVRDQIRHLLLPELRPCPLLLVHQFQHPRPMLPQGRYHGDAGVSVPTLAQTGRAGGRIVVTLRTMLLGEDFLPAGRVPPAGEVRPHLFRAGEAPLRLVQRHPPSPRQP